ncbi:CAP domain-containing protein [Eubacterium sp. LMAG:50]|uniref:CAP domain-containing protein n=1 Tax=Eubacterium sp. LMAG:50 TaxID=1969563 RepID=UPI0025BF9362|nr:CAP domain-containing protein [Eubacterium sp. LMAG:50]
MKRLKHVMAGIAFTFAVGLMLSCQVKAETTIDLNGNKVEVSVWTKQTSMKDGSYKIISSEAGTIAYFDKDGNLLKVENKSTGKIILNNIKEPETTTKQVETKVADKITMQKVKKLKKKTKYSYYKGVKSIKKNGKPNWGKIKYQYGIKLIWSKVKNAKGYEVYRYENAKGCWTKIKTVKKPTYTLTNMLEGEKVKIKVRAYKKTKNGNEYGKYSDVLSFTTKNMYTKIYKNGKTKGFFSKWASEDAFVIQNDMRVKVGAKPLKWSDRIYEIASLRAYMMATKDGLTHKGLDRDIKSIFTKYKVKDNKLKEDKYWKLDMLAENVAGAFKTPKTVVASWKNSKRHYKNMVNEDYNTGAIAVYRVYDFKKNHMTKWCSDFSDYSDYDYLFNEVM